MNSRIRIRELEPVDLEGGYLVDGFPSVGFSSAIATESMIQTMDFKMVGVIDSDRFPPISIIKNGRPNYPTGIFVNQSLKIAVFLSYLTLDRSMHRAVARAMLKWAKKHKIKLIVSSVAVKSLKEEAIGIGSTSTARQKIKDAGLQVLDHGTVSGIPGMLLNESSLDGQDAIIVIFQTDGDGPDYKSSAQLCNTMSRLIPGASCNIELLQKEAAKAELVIKEAEEESKHLKDSMYR